MEQLEQIIKQLIEKMGFSDFSVSFDSEGNRFSILINDGAFLEKSIPDFIVDFNYLIKLVAKKYDLNLVIIDINNYRKQRQELILELARAAARKAVANKKEITLPPMNAFERRLVHMELIGRPDIKTESAGEEKERCVIIKPI
ncbi:MAG: R3H domain-containing nucleic acid-binding protein [Patescibacteria group bacterium]|nr:R3H domain-containing nucleic acid-binding protein [Patescibacteria group bacterium]